MKRLICGSALSLLLLAHATTAPAQKYFYYSPRAVSPEERGQLKGGVLVREVTVRKGDTLSGLSRRFSGRGSFYPQILLFNEIKNPNLIYIGELLKVPVTRSESAQQGSVEAAPRQQAQEAAAAQAPGGSAPPEQKQPAGEGDSKAVPAEGKRLKRQATKKSRRAAAASPSSPDEAKSGQRLFGEALKSYRLNDCRKALELFERFLAEHPTSPLVADASLYKADCYLKLSAD